jgi:hypothetical protein
MCSSGLVTNRTRDSSASGRLAANAAQAGAGRVRINAGFVI